MEIQTVVFPRSAGCVVVTQSFQESFFVVHRETSEDQLCHKESNSMTTSDLFCIVQGMWPQRDKLKLEFPK